MPSILMSYAIGPMSCGLCPFSLARYQRVRPHVPGATDSTPPAIIFSAGNNMAPTDAHAVSKAATASATCGGSARVDIADIARTGCV